MLASNVPNARDGVAVLTITESGTTTAVVEVDEGINTLVFTARQPRDRAGGEMPRARGNIAREAVTALETNTPVVVTTTTIVAAVAIIVRGPGWSRGFVVGRGWGRSRGRVAAEGTRGPLPALVTLRRGEGIRWLVGSTATLSRMPRPVEGAVGVGGWVGRMARSSLGETDVLGVPPGVRVSAVPPTSGEHIPELSVSTVIPVGENEGDGQNQENDTSNERHFGIDSPNERRVGGLSDEPETEEKKRVVGCSHRVRSSLYTSPD